MIKLIAIVGTNSKRSTKRQLLQYMQKHFADKAEIELVEIKDIPVFNKPADKQVPEAVLEIVAKLRSLMGSLLGLRIRPLYSSCIDECTRLALIRSLPIVE